MIPIEYFLLGVAVLLLLSVISSKASSQLGVPTLLLFLVIGMLAGSDGPGGIYFSDPWLAQSLGIVALIFILFSGGLDTRWGEIKPVLWKGALLSTVGVMITTIIVGYAAYFLLDFTLQEALLLAAIISSTDAAAVFSVLRSKKISLKGELRPLLELESGSNDPMAIFLTASLIGLIMNPASQPTALIPMFAQQMALGAVFGYIMGRAVVFSINRIRLDYQGLYPILTVSLILLTYGLTSVLGGNGFLAVYLAGLTMGNYSFIHKRSLMHYHDSLAWMMQIAMFLTLGLLVFPYRLIPIAGISLLISFLLMFLARPISVLLCLAPFKMPMKDRVLISWVGLRGSVPIILATFPLLAGIQKADTIFNIVFFVVLTSVLVQGSSIPFVARRLGLEAPMESVSEQETVADREVWESLVKLKVASGSAAVGKQIADLNIPDDTWIAVLRRNGHPIRPGGSTVLQAGDRLSVQSSGQSLDLLRSQLETREGADDEA
ncbi:MAG: Na(+)/H(+) antiporter 1 [Methanosaeta sp. PtaB.Bin039]|nr:MAG: Na(+)/H(+) antiporter 1 [Methanosaeta sp. PtaB.Bin039]OPY45281.1 MAG: Na(+)/H(+) antiporter 1 [Methanosaeta sp. PtaU1.Bin028]HOT06784.1 potassium/proton antiporter [Methanotrichaceae archaeon]HQF15982.1 potassium/proton antiporter [Methanotrichaceae archaeon]HQI90670.1 potassium/proton antiporter [Methanotrichaceae archaeon]